MVPEALETGHFALIKHFIKVLSLLVENPRAEMGVWLSPFSTINNLLSNGNVLWMLKAYFIFKETVHPKM